MGCSMSNTLNYKIVVSIKKQTLQVFNFSTHQMIKDYRIATAKNGPGEKSGSECTPRGKHVIRAKIGDAEKINSVFIGRRPTGEIYQPQLKKDHPKRDWILTRLLWLSGCEVGINRLGNVDTMQRYVYIHGCPDEDPMGIPSSHGCIKMRNTDIIELFEMIPVYTTVIINEYDN